MDLETRIIAARATSAADAAAKADFIEEEFDHIDLRRLLSMILKLDAEHVGTAIAA